MVPNRQALQTRLNTSYAMRRKYCWRRLVWLFVILAGLFCLSCRERHTVPSSAPAAAPDAITATLENAQRDLEANTALEARITAELSKLKQDEQTPSEVIADMEAYLARVRAMVAENRQLVGQLEALHAQSTQSTAPRRATQVPPGEAVPVSQAQVSDDVGALDRELDASLADFDHMLLEELKLIREKTAPKMDSLAQEAADAAERLRQKGIDIDADLSRTESDTMSTPPASTADTASAESGPERDADAPVRNGAPDSPATSTEKNTAGTAGKWQKKSQRYDPKDDDIVARQLREAAEQETDPVLKEKLWREYEAYKRGGS
jgi:hypothetical protein